MKRFLPLAALSVALLAAPSARADIPELRPAAHQVLAASPTDGMLALGETTTMSAVALPSPVLADAAVTAPSSSFFSQVGGELLGFGLFAILVPLIGVLAHKYLPELEQKEVAAVDASPFFKQHPHLADFTKLFCHHVDLSLLKLSDTVVADAKAEGRFDAQLASKVRSNAIQEALLFCGQENRDALAKALGFTIPGMVDDYLNKLLEARLATLKAAGVIKPVATQGIGQVPNATPPAVPSVP